MFPRLPSPIELRAGAPDSEVRRQINRVTYHGRNLPGLDRAVHIPFLAWLLQVGVVIVFAFASLVQK